MQRSPTDGSLLMVGRNACAFMCLTFVSAHLMAAAIYCLTLAIAGSSGISVPFFLVVLELCINLFLSWRVARSFPSCSCLCFKVCNKLDEAGAWHAIKVFGNSQFPCDGCIDLAYFRLSG